MSQNKRNRLRPVMMNEIVGGQTYIRIGVRLDGILRISTQVFVGVPFKLSKGFRNSWRMKSPSSWMGRSSLFDAGAVPGSDYNQHRVFRYNSRNYAVLEDMVSRQALVEYLILIGMKNIKETLEKIRNRGEDFDSFWDGLEDLYDDSDKDFDAVDEVNRFY